MFGIRKAVYDESRPTRQKSMVYSSRISYFLDDGPKSNRVNTITSNPMSKELFEQYLTFSPHIITKLIDKKEIYVTGCCLLADISGFTKLSSNLCNKGPSGLDSLRIVINHSFASFVDIIHQFGGDGIHSSSIFSFPTHSNFTLVIAFAGDSLLCLFLPSSSHSTDSLVISSSSSYECCLRAIQCGLYISKCHIEATTTHIGITYGQLCVALLGSHITKSQQNHCSIVMNGCCVDELAVCLDHAKSEEVVISSALYHQIKMNNPFETASLGLCSHGNNLQLECHLLVNRSSSVPLLRHDLILHTLSIDDEYTLATSTITSSKLNANLFDVLSGVIPSPVVQAASTQSFNHLSEIRTVTTLFMKLDSYSTSRFQSLLSLRRFYDSMIDCLEDCGGMLRQFLIDDKGCVFIGLWGVPTANHPNNCCMAVRCSVLMKIKAKELGEIISIGVTTGSVYCGIVGGTKRGDYVAIGHSVNLSARLMCKAHGSIYLDQTTQQKLPLVLMNHIVQVKDLVLKGINTSASSQQKVTKNTSATKTSQDSSSFSSSSSSSPSSRLCFYQYDSLILPSERLRDVHEEQMVIIDHYIKRKRKDIFQVIGFYECSYSDTPGRVFSRYSTGGIKTPVEQISSNWSTTSAPLPGVISERLFDVDLNTSRSNIKTPTLHHATSSISPLDHPHVLIVQGGSGSGKTATINYFLRKIHDDLITRTGKLIFHSTNPSHVIQHLNGSSKMSDGDGDDDGDSLMTDSLSQNPIVYVSLLVTGDNYPYYAIQYIFETALDRGKSLESYHRDLKSCLFTAFPNMIHDPRSSSLTIFTMIQEALHLNITFEDFLQITFTTESSDTIRLLPNALHEPTDFTPMTRTVLFSKLLSCVIEMKGIHLLVVEDAHFMCKSSWDIFSHFCSNENLGKCFVMLSMRKDSHGHVTTADHVIKSATPSAKTSASLSYASSVMTTYTATQKKITHISSAQNTR
jgi:class 3 adenylate cyclase